MLYYIAYITAFQQLLYGIYGMYFLSFVFPYLLLYQFQSFGQDSAEPAPRHVSESSLYYFGFSFSLERIQADCSGSLFFQGFQDDLCPVAPEGIPEHPGESIFFHQNPNCFGSKPSGIL